MLLSSHKLTDNLKDEISFAIHQFNSIKTWDKQKKDIYDSIEKMLESQKYIRFTGDSRHYHLYRKGESCLYDVPATQQGALKAFRNKRVRLVCAGAWNAFSGRFYYAKEVAVVAGKSFHIRGNLTIH